MSKKTLPVIHTDITVNEDGTYDVHIATDNSSGWSNPKASLKDVVEYTRNLIITLDANTAPDTKT